MEKRILGRTNLPITALSYGAMELGKCESDAHAERVLNLVLDEGINYIDTSPEYILSEERIGKAISHRRDEYILSTKCGDLPNSPGYHYEFSKKIMTDNIENSLRLLKTDYIDIWQLHGATPMHFATGEADEAFEVMKDMKKAGKVRFLGVTMRHGRPYESAYPVDSTYFYAPVFAQYECLDMMQIVYSGMARGPENILEGIAKKGKGIVARSALNRFKPQDYDALWESARMNQLLESGDTRSDFLLRFAMSHPYITTCLIGSKNEEHIKANIAAARRGALPDRLYQEAKYRLEKPYTLMNL
jgi:Predicted oxidoreductases (related to aryl-alcohol dehydrogenases)